MWISLKMLVLAIFASASDHARLTLAHAPMVKNIHKVYAPLVHDLTLHPYIVAIYFSETVKVSNRKGIES